tara:strand:+ start:750 stop:1724 length:975 start_codon:yes stop_codon:yes gene_type:complete
MPLQDLSDIVNSTIDAAYVFPGQGAQFVGMGRDLYQTSERAKEIIDSADDYLSFPLKQVMFEGPHGELEKTENCQPAIMVVSLAYLAAFEEKGLSDGFKPIVLAGHSLGEYTAMVVAEVMGFEEGVRLVRERGQLMQQASVDTEGSMAAIIGLSQTVLQSICEDLNVQLANINSENQIVISGERTAVAKAVEKAKNNGARKSVPLNVFGAFHSHLMATAQSGLDYAVNAIDIKSPKIPIVANITAGKLSTAVEIREELSKQLCSCVQWKDSVKTIIDMGVSTFLEFGPGRVLSGLVKRIDSGVSSINAADLINRGHMANSGSRL